jgi:DNA uptake protein ComE-like DNA-binding protein
MSNPTSMKKDDFRKLIRDYFSFSGSERNGMILLCAVLLVAIILNQVIDYFDFKIPAGQEEFIKLTYDLDRRNLDENSLEKMLFAFDPNTISDAELEALNIPSKIKINLVRYRQKGGSFQRPEDFRKLYGMTDSLYNRLKPYIRLTQKPSFTAMGNSARVNRNFFEFDPNSVTEEQLYQLGFNAFQTRNLLAFRNKGGRFHQKSDVLKIFGMDSVFYREIKGFILITPTQRQIMVEKVQPIIELNVTDSAELTTLPGIGPVFAGRIIHYRQVVGGFFSIDQLQEVYGMTPEKFLGLKSLVKTDPSLITPLRLNFADYSVLNRHPYISSKQAGNIISWRSAHGPFINMEILKENGIFDENAYNKVKPYLTCQ